MADEKKSPDRLAQVEAENAALKDRLANVEKLLAMQQPVTAPIKESMDREAEFELRKNDLSLSVKERTQAIARKRWTDSKTEYPVQVADVPLFMIPARSPEEAKGRYDVLCGILGVDSKHKYQIGQPVNVTNAA